jgi:hypothetical protein
MLPKMASDGLYRPTLDHFPPPHEQLRNTTGGRSVSLDVMGPDLSAAIEPYHRQSDNNPRVSLGQTHLPHPSVRRSWDDSLYHTRSDSSSRTSWQDSAVPQRRSWGSSCYDQGVDVAYGSTAHTLHDDQQQQLWAKTVQLTQLIEQLRERVTKVEVRTSALEESLADRKANSTKKSGGGSKAGSNSHLLLKVSQRRRSLTSL